MKLKSIVLIIIMTLTLAIGCSDKSVEVSKDNTGKNSILKNKEDSTYVNIKYDPSKLGIRARKELGEEVYSYYREILIPAVLNRQGEIELPSNFTREEKGLLATYFQENCPLEYFAGSPFFTISWDKITIGRAHV